MAEVSRGQMFRGEGKHRPLFVSEHRVVIKPLTCFAGGISKASAAAWVAQARRLDVLEQNNYMDATFIAPSATHGCPSCCAVFSDVSQ